MTPRVCCLLLLLILALNSSAGVSVTRVWPRKGSTQGETRLTIFGNGFAKDQFNFGAGNSHLGNQVMLVSGSQQYPCTIHVDGSHEEQIMCYTPMGLPDGVVLYVKVYVDGKLVADDNMCGGFPESDLCGFTPSFAKTPRIVEMQPQSGPIGTVVTMEGVIFTDRYETNEAESSNGRENKIVRAYFNGQTCELRKPLEEAADELYGLKLKNGSNSGHLSCNITGTYVGNQNGSFIVSGEFGRTQPMPGVLRVTGQNKIAMFQSYADVTGINPSNGSVSGGTLLTVRGKNFDETDAPAQLQIAGTPCHVVDVEDSQILCETEAQSQQPWTDATAYSGNRGVLLEIWNSSDAENNPGLEDALHLDSATADHSVFLDQLHFDWKKDNASLLVSRVRGFFIPPSDSEYTFFIKSADESKLFFLDEATGNRTLLAECWRYSNSYYTFPGQKSRVLTLRAAHPLYLEIVHQKWFVWEGLSVAVLMHQTSYTASQTDSAHNERQIISFHSTPHQEIQEIKLSGVSSQSAVSEVQVIDITSDYFDGLVYRLGVDGVFTGQLTVRSSASDVQSAVNKLPTVSPSRITLSMSDISGGKRLKVTLPPTKGDLSDMEVLRDSSSQANLTYSVSEQTKGRSAMDSFFLTFDGVVSEPIAVDASAEDMRDALLSIVSVRCPSELTNPAGRAYFENFESIDTSAPGERVSTIAPFCGRASAKNPWAVFVNHETPYNAFQYREVCFAYLGALVDSVTVHFYHKKGRDEHNYWATFEDVSFPESTTWQYVCFDIRTRIQERFSDVTNAFVKHVQIFPQSVDKDVYIDEVYIGSRRPTEDFEGIADAMRLYPSNWWIHDIDVTGDVIDGFNVTMQSVDCAHQLPLLKLYEGQVILATPQSIEQSQESWPAGATVTTRRVQHASPPIAGNFSVTFNDQTLSGIPAGLGEDELSILLQTLPDMGAINVQTTGDCAAFQHNIEWLTSGGDQPPLTINDTGLTGIDVIVEHATEQDGGVFYDPIPGDLLRTRDPLPQVSVLINNIPSKCTGSCSFQWLRTETRNITAISPTEGSAVGSTVLTITGEGFSSNVTDNVVMIGGVPCIVISSSVSQIQCLVGEGPAGAHKVELYVYPSGTAAHIGQDFYFTYLFELNTIEPTGGSLAGGTVLTVAGTGFGPAVHVWLDEYSCHITSLNYSHILCLTPAVDQEGIVKVAVSDGNKTAINDVQFNYNTALTPTVLAINTTTAALQGGTVLQVNVSIPQGVDIDPVVTLGGQEAALIDASSAGVIAVMLPGLRPGSYPLTVRIEGMGYADLRTNNIPDIDYVLRVDAISPTHGSLRGGTRVTILGQFSTQVQVDDLEVIFGETSCQVETVSTTKLTCVIGETGKTHKVDNRGVHVDYGQYYRWQPYLLDIFVGDEVEWSWSTPSLVKDVAFKVQQTSSAASIEYNGVGFTSGSTGSKTGRYRQRFTIPGVYYYSSGPVDASQRIVLHGAIHVHDRISVDSTLRLYVAGFEATYNTSAVLSKPADNPVCPGTTDVIANCLQSQSDLEPDTNNSNFQFIFHKCSTPTVEQIFPQHIASDGTVAIHGTGFSAVACQNLVSINDVDGDNSVTCNVTSSNETTIICDVINGEHLPVGISLPVRVTVSNRGHASFVQPNEQRRGITLMPFISSLSPQQGSLRGNTLVTILGGGFGRDPSLAGVVLANTQCSIQTISPTEITCLTVPSAEYNGDCKVTVVTMYVVPDGSRYDSVYVDSQCSGDCRFHFTGDATPNVLSVTPSSVTERVTDVTISGSKFGTDDSVVTVYVGASECVVQQVTDSDINCTLEDPFVGLHPLHVHAADRGDADVNNLKIRVLPTVYNIQPESGSVEGGAVVHIEGLGFYPNDTSVTVDGGTCKIVKITNKRILCTMPKGVEGSANVIVISGSDDYPMLQFNYSTALTPVVNSMSPTAGTAGDTVTIAGSGFGNEVNNITVMVGDAECTVTSITNSQIICTLGPQIAGLYSLQVSVAPVGHATSSATFTYETHLTAIWPEAGSVAGGQLVRLTGSGMDSSATSLYICDQKCVVDANSAINPSQFHCRTPPKANERDTCDVVLVVAAVNSSLPAAYTYDDDLTPIVTDVTPRRGGTAGGTKLTIQGQRFGNDPSNVTVTLAGTECIVESTSDTNIVCQTQAHRPSVIAEVEVTVGNLGIASQGAQESATFQYVDVWSSQFSWNYHMPQEGDLVVIPADMTILLDVDTPILKLLLIQGKLVFDEVDVELNAEIILITDGGVLQVGTEEEPFQHRATITLHGHVKSKELPIYGTKVIAVREGTLDLHGKPAGITWTRLDATAEPGDDYLYLEKPVQWKAGDKVVLATTGDRHSQRENEVREILRVSDDGLRIDLTVPLQYKHLGETVQLADGFTLDVRAEVGLLSHNVVVRGSDDNDWHDVVKPCPDGFNTGEFATQTCFQGRFGEEIGSSQYGSQILLHAPVKDKRLAVGRLENVEVTFAGQAFRLGRYAIHFHLNGDMTGSYVRGCSVHKSFNRAVNVHGTHNVVIEHNVIYDIMGGAFFTEDGVETGNVFQYNLAIFVISSTSLQNDDITPAAFWVTNPNNTVRHNAAAGGTHFGFWYRMHEHPDGPSADPNVCPRNVPLGVFANNTVHSHGWFGLWIFRAYHPMKGGGCDSTEPIPAQFYGLTAWNCEKGSEWVEGGAIQFHNFVLVNNDVGAIDAKLVLDGTEPYSDKGALIKDCVIAGHGQSLDILGETSTRGLILPYSQGLTIEGVTFINYDSPEMAAMSVTHIDGSTEDDNGGFTYQTKQLSFINAPMVIFYRWVHDAVFHDIDGTLTGGAHQKVVTTSGLLPSKKCWASSNFSVNSAVPGSVCDSDVRFHRWSFNDPQPTSLLFKNAVFTNRHGTAFSPWREKRVTHKHGWMVVLPDGDDFIMSFEDSQYITNISYTGIMYDFGPDDYVIISHNVSQFIDHLTTEPGRNVNSSRLPLNASVNVNGDWYFDKAATYFSYLVSATSESESASSNKTVNRAVEMDAYQCFYENCIAPIGNGQIETPEDVFLWSDPATWEGVEEGYGGNNGDGTFSPPQDGTDVQIPSDKWVVADVQLPVMNKLYIYGVLELDNSLGDNGHSKNFTLTATHILIAGGHLIIGRSGVPFKGLVQIILRGTHSSEEMPLPSGPNLGAKALGAFGGLDIHGVQKTIGWTRLAQTALAGDRRIVLSDPVDWKSGDELVIVTTSYRVEETEVMVIESVSNDSFTLTLTAPVSYTHLVSHQQLINETKFTMAAEVGLLSRNIRIVGEDYQQMQQQAFGARVLVGNFWNEGFHYKGYARLSNVEFYHTGQEGFTDSYDPRFSLAFLDADTTRPSYVHHCTFHHGFSPAIGVYGTNYVEIVDNVVYHTVGAALQIEGMNNVIRHNLVSSVLSPGTFNGREEVKFFWDAGIQINHGSDYILQDNVVVGSEGSGFHIDGHPCGASDSFNTIWSNNEAHSSLIGVMMEPDDGFSPCTLISNFSVYHNWDFGIYYQTMNSLEVSNIVSIDNGLSLFPLVFGPTALSHDFENKYVQVTDSTFVGTSDGFNCSDSPPPEDPNIKASELGRSWRTRTKGKVGLTWATFSSKDNGLPTHPLIGIISYPAIRGIMLISGVNFVNFGQLCAGVSDVAITTNPGNDDAMHPVRISQTTLRNVADSCKVFVHRPNVGKVNPADCVDMDCDGMKKAILEDIDGTFLGSPGTIIPESEYEWDGDPRRGLGNHRIPNTLITDQDGNQIPVTDIAPNKGIIRDESCQLVDSYQSYECHGLDYEMLILESLDSDTETRRLSPLAVLGDGYLDLINGPQDHGWCSGYTCQKRLSTFNIILATGKMYEIYYTGTPPQDTRLHLLNAGEDQAVVLAIHYPKWRQDVYVDDIYQLPTNSHRNEQNQVLLHEPSFPEEFIPELCCSKIGTNYFDQDSRMLYVLVGGSTPVDITTRTMITVSISIPAMTVEDFFGEELVNNLALFLDIPKHKIRIAQAVPETKRRKRDTSLLVRIEISNVPSDRNSSSNSSSDPEDISALDAQVLLAKIVSAYQTGSLAEVLNLTIGSMSIIEPPPPTDTEAWTYVVMSDGEEEIVVQIPEKLQVLQEPGLSTEDEVFHVQPVVVALDSEGSPVKVLGSTAVPWQVTASLRLTGDSHPDAVLEGSMTIPFINGMANYTSLSITHRGDYMLDFIITSPAEVDGFVSCSAVFTVSPLQLSGVVVQQPSNVPVDEDFTLTISITNGITGDRLSQSQLMNESIQCLVALHDSEESLQGHLSASVDLETGAATFENLRLSAFGVYFFDLHCMSTSGNHDFTVRSPPIELLPENFGDIEGDISNEVTLKFDADYDEVVSGKEDSFKAVVQNYLWRLYPGVYFSNFNVSAGSILVQFMVTGNNATMVESVIEDIWNQLETMVIHFNGHVIPAMTVMWLNGERFYGDEEDDNKTDLVWIIAVSVLCAVFLIVAIVVIIYKISLRKGKTTRPDRKQAFVHQDFPDSDRSSEAGSSSPDSRASFYKPLNLTIETPRPGTPSLGTPRPGTPSLETPRPGTPSLETPRPGTPSTTSLYGHPGQTMDDSMASPDPVVTPQGQQFLMRLNRSVSSEMRHSPSRLIEVSPAPSRCQTPDSGQGSDC